MERSLERHRAKERKVLFEPCWGARGKGTGQEVDWVLTAEGSPSFHVSDKGSQRELYRISQQVEVLSSVHRTNEASKQCAWYLADQRKRPTGKNSL